MDLKTKKRTLYASMALALVAGSTPAVYAADAPQPFQQSQQKGEKIQGHVVDSNGEPLIGVSVLVKGTKTGAVTDLDGNFTINANSGALLVISYVGYETKTVKATDGMNVTLNEDAAAIEEVVVVGYGVQKKKLVTGATTQIKGDDIAKLNTTNPLAAMQGQT